MKIHVTQEHINKGIRTDPSHCPIAWALKSSIPDCNPSVGTLSACLWQDCSTRLDFDLSPPAKAFVAKFDNQLPVSPFAFDVPELDGLATAQSTTCPICDGAGTITVAEKPQQKEACVTI